MMTAKWMKKRKFRKECKGAIVWMLFKLVERLLTNKAASLSPQNTHRNPAKLAEDSNH